MYFFCLLFNFHWCLFDIELICKENLLHPLQYFSFVFHYLIRSHDFLIYNVSCTLVHICTNKRVTKQNSWSWFITSTKLFHKYMQLTSTHETCLCKSMQNVLILDERNNDLMPYNVLHKMLNNFPTSFPECSQGCVLACA